MSDNMDILLALILIVCIGIAVAICGHGCHDTLVRWTGIGQPYTEVAR